MIYFLKSLVTPCYNFIKLRFVNYKLEKKNKGLKLRGKTIIYNTIFSSNNYIIDSVLIDSKIGKFSYISKNSSIRNTKIGNYTCIGPNVKVGLGEHPSHTFVSVHPIFYSDVSHFGYKILNKSYFEEYKPTTIGNDVWVGANVIIKGGVKVGNGAIIAAGSVVTKDIPAFAIVGGVPAKVLKYRFTDEEISVIEKSKWWEFDYEKQADIDHFRNISDFVIKHRHLN